MAAVTRRLKRLVSGRERPLRRTRVIALFFTLSLLISVPENVVDAKPHKLMTRAVRVGLAVERGGSVAAPQAGSGDTGAKAESAIRRLFGAGLEAAKDRRPYFLTGDFNGDARQDLLLLVHLKQAQGGLPKDVVVLNPWGYEKKDSQGASDLALAIIHGAGAGWDSAAPPAGKYLLRDREYFSTPTWDGPTPEGTSLLSLRKKRPGNRAEAAPRMAKGDAIMIPTEAGIDIYLYWDGKTYKIYEPAEEP